MYYNTFEGIFNNYFTSRYGVYTEFGTVSSTIIVGAYFLLFILHDAVPTFAKFRIAEPVRLFVPVELITSAFVPFFEGKH